MVHSGNLVMCLKPLSHRYGLSGDRVANTFCLYEQMIFFNNCIQSEEFALIRVLGVVQWILALLNEALHLLLMIGGENLSLLEGVEKASVQNSRVCVSKFLHENESLSSNMKVPLSTMEPSFLYSFITFCTASGCHRLSWYVSPKGQLFGETVSVHEHSRCR